MSKVKETIMIPVKGRYENISETPDQVFSNKFLGEGFVVFPEKGEVFSPVDGIIKTVFPTKHAITLQSSKGLNILIHIGLETVSLKGEGFKMNVTEGQEVKQGDLLVTFDIEYIEKHAESSATPIVFVEKKELKIKKTKEIQGNTYITVITE